MLNSTEHKISTAHKKLNYQQMKKFFALRLSDVVLIMLINVKMPTLVGILKFMSMLSDNVWCVKETFLLRTITYVRKRQLLKWFINRPISLNPVCAIFNSNKRVFRTTGVRISESIPQNCITAI